MSKLTNKKYKVVDLYDGCDLVGYASDHAELQKLINKHVADTDGECWIDVREYNEGLGMYVRKEGK